MTMFSRIQAAEKTELIPIGTLLASLVLGIENTVEQDWLTRKVRYLRIECGGLQADPFSLQART